MACCKCCCGGVDCTEGQEGKCCCGGVYGECCQEGEYCCSGVCQGVPCDECVCPEGCVPGLAISLGGTPACLNEFYTDGIACTSGVIAASMYCDNGDWFVYVSVCCFENGGSCFYSYEATLPCEDDNLPPAGSVSLTQTSGVDNGGCPSLPPSVTIIK